MTATCTAWMARYRLDVPKTRYKLASLPSTHLVQYGNIRHLPASYIYIYSTVALVPPMSTMYVWRGIT